MKITKNYNETEEVTGKITPGVVLEWINETGESEIPPLMLVVTLKQKLAEWEAERTTRRRYTEDIEVTAEIDVNVQLDHEDMIDLIDCNRATALKYLDIQNFSAYRKVIDMFSSSLIGTPENPTILDVQKLSLLADAMRKYSLDELESRLR